MMKRLAHNFVVYIYLRLIFILNKFQSKSFLQLTEQFHFKWVLMFYYTNLDILKS